MDAVLFDLDGTLIDTRRLYGAAYRQAFADVLDVPPSLEALVARRPSSERLFLVDWYGESVGNRIHQRMLFHYEAHASALLGGFFDGVGEMVDAIRSQGHPIGIVTGKSRAAYEVTCRHLDLSAFDVVVVEDDVPVAKPDPAGIRRALGVIGARTGVYVGDTAMDLEAAHHAGLRGAAALWSRPKAERGVADLDDEIWPLLKPTDLLPRLGH